MQKSILEEKIKAYLKRADLSQASVARKLNYTSGQLNRWVRGFNRFPDIAIRELADLLGLTDEERAELFTLAGYVAITAPKEKLETTDDYRVAPIYLISKFFIDTLKDWNNNFFHWSEASDRSWTGLAMHAMRIATNRITSGGFLAFCVSILLGVITTQLIAPTLQWPLDETEVRWLVYLKYGLATLLIPLLVASITPTDNLDHFQLETPKQQIIFWVLKFTGAVVGFWTFSLIVISLAIACYYLYLPPLAFGVRLVLALIPLFFSYLTAQHIPFEHPTYDKKLYLHAVDRLVLAVFIPAGPFVAIFLYFSYSFLLDRSIAPVTLVALITVIALWEYRKRHPQAISDPILILILGLVIPVSVLFYAFLTTPGVLPPSPTKLPPLIVVSIYILSWTLLLATILVRNGPTLALRGIFSLLGIVTLAILVAAINFWLGIGFVCLVVLIWMLWGRKRFGQYFGVHGSFWAIVVITGIGIYLSVFNTIPIWVNGLSFTLSAVLLIGWAYQIPDQKELPLDEAA